MGQKGGSVSQLMFRRLTAARVAHVGATSSQDGQESFRCAMRAVETVVEWSGYLVGHHEPVYCVRV